MLNNNFNSDKRGASERSLFFILSLSVISTQIIYLSYTFSGIEVQAYNIFGIIFIVLFSLIGFRNSRIILYKRRKIFPLVLLMIAMMFAAAVSVVGAFFTLGDLAQFSKGFAELAFVNIFAISVIIFLGKYRYLHADYFLRLLIGVLSISCLYQFLAIYFKVINDIDLDSLIWPLISSWTPSEEDISIGGKGFFLAIRHGGFSNNPNTLATLLIAAIPLSLYFASSGQKWMYFVVSIFFIAMLTTLSRSGLLGLGVSLMVMGFIGDRLPVKRVAFGLSALMTLPLIIYFIEQQFDLSLLSRFLDILYFRLSESNYQDSPRSSLFTAGIDMFSKSPFFGVGINSSPVILGDYEIFKVTGGSLHNYWLELLVALGVFVIPYFLYYIYFLYESFTSKGIYSKALFASLCGLIVNASFHSSLAGIPVQIFILLLYLASLAPKTND
jgi:hypothetical protein